MTPEYAAVISAVSAAINTVAVLVSLGLVIWTSFFWKTRRDRIDELKVEMQIKLSQGWTDKIIKTHDMDKFMQFLGPKFQKKKYKVLLQCAYNELAYEGKNEVVEYHKGRQEMQEKMQDRLRARYEAKVFGKK